MILDGLYESIFIRPGGRFGRFSRALEKAD